MPSPGLGTAPLSQSQICWKFPFLSSNSHSLPQPSSSLPGNNSMSAPKVGQMMISYFLVVLEIKYS